MEEIAAGAEFDLGWPVCAGCQPLPLYPFEVTVRVADPPDVLPSGVTSAEIIPSDGIPDIPQVPAVPPEPRVQLGEVIPGPEIFRLGFVPKPLPVIVKYVVWPAGQEFRLTDPITGVGSPILNVASTLL
jgi:hypothetical protein